MTNALARQSTKLVALRTELARMVNAFDHGTVDECRVVQVLAGDATAEPSGTD